MEQSLRKFPRLYRTAGLVDWKNLPDQPGFHQTDTIWEQTTKKKKYKFLSLNVIMYKYEWPQNIHDSSVNKILIAAKTVFQYGFWLVDYNKSIFIYSAKTVTFGLRFHRTVRPVIR